MIPMLSEAQLPDYSANRGRAVACEVVLLVRNVSHYQSGTVSVKQGSGSSIPIDASENSFLLPPAGGITATAAAKGHHSASQ